MKYDFVIFVEGQGQFPVDMLRYDDCRPRKEADAWLIVDSFVAPPLLRRVELLTHRDHKLWAPTGPRWASFGWHVVGLEMLR